MSTHLQATDTIRFNPINNRRLINLCGPGNENIRQIEDYFDIEIHQRSNQFHIIGYQLAVQTASDILNKLYQATRNNNVVTPSEVHSLLTQVKLEPSEESTAKRTASIKTRSKVVKASNKNQQQYIANIHRFDIDFAIGPAGTGKTYLAVACAVEALDRGEVQRLIFVRPAVEAGEKLGFLPGDLEEKILPYLRPLYDALYETLGFDQAKRLIDQDVIEIAPLAFMRGRTLNDAFIILDEAQNTTTAQMKMFLTRIGFGSTAVITGDITQIDLPRGILSGLKHANEIFKDIDNISFSYFSNKDIVRHPLVSEIIQAYEKDENRQHQTPVSKT